MGSSAFLIVPAMHAAERRSLNSYPSFDTNVTYSVGFSSAMVACNEWKGSVYVRGGKQGQGSRGKLAASRAVTFSRVVSIAFMHLHHTFANAHPPS